MKKTGYFFEMTITSAGILFASLVMVSSFVVMKSSLIGGVWYGFWLLFIWCALEYAATANYKFSCCREIITIMILCLLLHLFLIELLPSLGANVEGLGWDYRRAFVSMLSGKICFVHNIRHTYWCNYEIVLSTLSTIFKGSLELGQVVNAISHVLVLIPVYIISCEIAGRRMARLTTLIIGFSPALILMSLLLTGEFLSSALMFFAFYFSLKSIVPSTKSFSVTAAFLGGLSLGLSYLFKTITIVFWASLVVVLVLRWSRWRMVVKISKLIIADGIFLFAYLATIVVGEAVLASLANNPNVGRSSGGQSDLPYELALGLNLETDGTYNDKLAVDMRKKDTEQQIQQVRLMIARDWKHYPMLMVRKFTRIHGSHNTSVGGVTHVTGFFREKTRNGKGWRWFVPKWIAPLTDCGTMVFEVWFLLGALGLGFALVRMGNNSLPGMFALVLVLGFAVIEQLIEGYGRYKIGIYPFYFMIIPYAGVTFGKIRALAMDAWGRVCQTHMVRSVTSWINDER